MKKLPLSFVTIVAVTLSGTSARAAEEPWTRIQLDAKYDAKEVAVLKTSAGEMVVEFWPEVSTEDRRELQDFGEERIL